MITVAKKIAALEAVLADLRAMKDGRTPTEMRISARRAMRERAAKEIEDRADQYERHYLAATIRALPVEE